MKKVKNVLAVLALALVLLWAGYITMAVTPALDPMPVIAQGGVTGFANLRISNFYRAQPRASITITNGATLNATGTFQRITSVGAAGTSGAAITVKPAGTILILLNVGANTITFTETGTLKSAGNIALGALDSAALVSDGTNWYQWAASNN